MTSIQKSKNAKLANFIFALGIGNIGVKTAKQLAKHYKTIENLQNATIEDLVTLDDIAEITATEIYHYFSEPFNRNEIAELLANDIVLENIQESTVSEGSYFAGKKVVLTGTLANFSRSQAEEIIERMGGATSSSVTSATNIVLAGENAGSKLDKAKKLGIQIMSETEFLEIINS